jgi:hypothetical protein
MKQRKEKVKEGRGKEKRKLLVSLGCDTVKECGTTTTERHYCPCCSPSSDASQGIVR